MGAAKACSLSQHRGKETIHSARASGVVPQPPPPRFPEPLWPPKSLGCLIGRGIPLSRWRMPLVGGWGSYWPNTAVLRNVL